MTKLKLAIDALKEIKEAIIQNATDTLWMHKEASVNCTAVDWIDMALADIEALPEKSTGDQDLDKFIEALPHNPLGQTRFNPEWFPNRAEILTWVIGGSLPEEMVEPFEWLISEIKRRAGVT